MVKLYKQNFRKWQLEDRLAHGNPNNSDEQNRLWWKEEM